MLPLHSLWRAVPHRAAPLRAGVKRSVHGCNNGPEPQGSGQCALLTMPVLICGPQQLSLKGQTLASSVLAPDVLFSALPTEASGVITVLPGLPGHGLQTASQEQHISHSVEVSYWTDKAKMKYKCLEKER